MGQKSKKKDFLNLKYNDKLFFNNKIRRKYNSKKKIKKNKEE
jgi:hypothetical protein